MKKKFFTSRGVWDNGIFVIRLLTAVMIIPHGLEMFDSAKMNDNLSFLKDIKFPLPVFMGYFAKVVELLGGTLLAAGLFTRLVTIPLMIIMVVITANMNNWNIFNGELTFLFFLLFLMFLFTGPGKWSLDYWLFDKNREDKSK